MANAFYAKGKEKMLSGLIDFTTANIKAALVSTSYPQNLTTDEFFSEVSTYVLGAPIALTSKTTTGGVFDAADVTFPAVAAGATAEGLILYKDTGAASTSPLIAYIDAITGFPLATSGGDIVVQWDNGAYKIFSL